MRKFLVLVIVLLLTFSSTIYASNESNEVPTTEGIIGIYDKELGGTIVAVYTVGSDGSLVEKPLSQYAKEIKENVVPYEYQTPRLNSLLEQIGASSKPVVSLMPYDFYYYEYIESSTSNYTAATRRVSDDFTCTYNPNGCPLAIGFSTTTTSAFSSNVNVQAKKDAVTAGITFGYTYSSASATSTTFTDLVPQGKTGYVGFQPYMKQSQGTLKYWHQWGSNTTLVSSENASVSVPRTYSTGGNTYTLGNYLIVLTN
ncbi:hypothetical protein ACX1C1_10470 [Paenibacillus sp. strain BS8-2]